MRPTLRRFSRAVFAPIAALIASCGFAAEPAPASPPATPITPPPAEPRSFLQLYRDMCASCHGRRWEGSRAPSMLDDVWAHEHDDAGLAKSIRDGWPANGMPGFAAALSELEIRALVMSIHEARAGAQRAAANAKPAPPLDGRVIKSELQTFKVEVVAEKLETPWAINFLPDGRMLVPERVGRLSIIEAKPGGAVTNVRGLPSIWVRQDGGLLDVALHPDFARNGWVYLAFTETGGSEREGSTTKIIRATLKGDELVEQLTIFQAAPELYWNSNIHYGTRFFFDREGFLFFGLGDRGRPQLAQDLTSPYGKLHRSRADGSIPNDNPFVKQPGAVRSIWSYGHRNQQGIAQDPRTGTLWATEHGPRGGDEINIIQRGRNYGWPVVHFGISDTGTVPEKTARPNMESPIDSWTPSIAPGALLFYTGDKYPRWKNQLFAACLAGKQLRRFEIKGREIVQQEAIAQGIGRVREVTVGPDGLLYLALNTQFENSPGQIVRLVPVE